MLITQGLKIVSPWRIGIGLVLCFAVSVISILNYSGYCYSRGGFVSDDEMLASAVKSTLKFDKSTFGEIENERHALPYRDTAEFLAMNPNCCIINGAGSEGYKPTPSFVERFLGMVNKWVGVEYKRRYLYQDGHRESETRKSFYVFDNCGADVTYRYE